MYYESSSLSFTHEPLSRNERNALRFERSQSINDYRKNMPVGNKVRKEKEKKGIGYNIFWIGIIIVSIISMLNTYKII